MPGKQSLICLFIICLFIPLSVSAGQFGFSASAGGGPAFGDIGKIAPVGGLGSLGISFQPDPKNSPEITILGQFKYMLFPSDKDASGDFQYLLAGLEFKLELRHDSRLLYFVFIEGGLARTEHKENEYTPSPGASKIIQPSYTENNPFVSPGVGLNILQNQKMTFFVELRAINIFGQNIKNHTLVPLMVGIQF